MKPKASLRFFLALSGSTLLASQSHAAIRNWDGDISADWAVANNWDTAPLTTDIANFNLATYGGNPVFAPDAGTTSIDGITIGAANGAMTLTTTGLSIGGSGISMANGAGAFTVAGGVTLGASQIWTNNSSSLFTADGAVNGASANTNLELAGSGSFIFNDAIGSNIGNVNITSVAGSSVTFTTANTFTGNLHLFNGSTINFSAVNQLGSGTGANYIAIQNGSTFNYTGSGSESISGRRIYWNIGAANVGVTNAGANLTLDLDTTGGDRNQTFNKGGAGTLTFTGTGGLSGNVNINNGTLKLSQTTGYASPITTVAASGTLELNKTATGHANRGTQLTRNITGDGTLHINSDTSGINGGWVTLIAGGSNLVNFTGTINVKSGVLSMDNLNGTLTGNPDLNVEAGGLFGIRGQNISVDALTGDGDVFNNWNGDSAGHTLTVGANNGSGTFSGVIHGDNSTNDTDGTIEAGRLHLTKTGTGTQILSGANTYSGQTMVTGGTLVLAHNSATGTSAGGIAVSGGLAATLQINSGITTADSITFSNTHASSSVTRTVAANDGIASPGADDYTTGTSGALKSSFAGGTPDTTVEILDGTNSDTGNATVLNMSLSASPVVAATNDGIRRSDVFNISGTTGTDAYVLQIALDGASLASDSVLGWLNPSNTWVAAGTNFVLGAYNNTLTVGNFGFDSGTHSVWAVVNHGGSFAAIPEPTSALAGLLLAAGLLRRRRSALKW